MGGVGVAAGKKFAPPNLHLNLHRSVFVFMGFRRPVRRLPVFLGGVCRESGFGGPKQLLRHDSAVKKRCAVVVAGFAALRQFLHPALRVRLYCRRRGLLLKFRAIPSAASGIRGRKRCVRERRPRCRAVVAGRRRARWGFFKTR